MSWDVFFLKFPEEINSISKIPDDFNPGFLCTREYYEDMIFKLFPDIDENNNRSWMILDEETYSIEFSAGNGKMLDSLMLHVRGDEKALEAIKRICEFTKWRALDTSTGNFLDFNNNPDEGFSQWRKFRDKVIPENNHPKGIKISKIKKHNKKWWEFWK
jgi:hypothetical protein